MQDELNWIPLGHRIGFLKHPDSEDYKCPVCGYEQYTIYISPPKRCPKCHSEMANGVDFRMEALGIMIDEMNDLQMPYTDPAPGDLVRVTRCKHCVHRQPDEQKYMCMLTITEQNCKEIYMGDNDYCSYGERKDEQRTEYGNF